MTGANLVVDGWMDSMVGCKIPLLLKYFIICNNWIEPIKITAL